MTQYERGVGLERQIEHYYKFIGFKGATRTPGSHGLYDNHVPKKRRSMYINAKLHQGLRDKTAEEALVNMERPEDSEVFTAWRSKLQGKSVIEMQNLVTRSITVIIPLTREQEKKYQEMKKAKYAAGKSAKSDIRLLSGVQQTKTTKRSKS